jgi:hypothetical protein
LLNEDCAACHLPEKDSLITVQGWDDKKKCEEECKSRYPYSFGANHTKQLFRCKRLTLGFGEVHNRFQLIEKNRFPHDHHPKENSSTNSGTYSKKCDYRAHVRGHENNTSLDGFELRVTFDPETNIPLIKPRELTDD